MIIADYSEYQGFVSPPAGQVVIIRAHNGYRPDEFFATNREKARLAGAPAVGLYQYLPAGVNPMTAARLLLETIGSLRPYEWLILDLEEGAGDQQGRWQAWASWIISATQRRPWLYSGLAFAQAHNLHPDWVADYDPVEPGIPHKLWQNTDAYPWPWGKGDASVFDGTLPEFLASIGIPVGPVTSAPAGPAVTKEKPVFIVDAVDTNTQFLVFDSGKVAKLQSTKIGSGLTAPAGPAGVGLPYITGTQADIDSMAKGYLPA